MADEAFALSPISARAAQPSEEDYDAISKAFMETSRGRWFLGEYAKRNRNADTSMVLEAVARLEENLAAQRQPQPADNGLDEALAAIRGAVNQARVAALDGLALEEKLGPVRKGSRIIREIAWRWREIGADGRICDLIDSQIGAIEAACGEIASINPLTAFDVIERQLAELSGGEAAASPQAPAGDTPSASAPPAPSDEMLAALVEPLETATSAAASADDSEAAVRASSVLAEQAIATAEAATTVAETAEVALAVETQDAMVETADAMAETADIAVEAVDAMAETDDDATEPQGLAGEAADAEDNAILDMIALEMAADDPSDFDDIAEIEPAEIAVAELAPAASVSAAPEPESEAIAVAVEPPAVEPLLQASGEPLQAAEEPSLGASLISRGILHRPQVEAADPLAPIRRMSQAEKIAFFS
ncbi:MAG: hypothetical protein Q7J60_08425 [Bradyrhizobium sp.]|uniref:hypothetical protein n=1 Tax=Bradyrhizobium sp. TaxID=376 RepID=UPI0027196E16|nr:hypothetical protein [Bradyrhizobium sp.]MDO9561630.1 hypothetical protein [Bradyrhizobium sp.]MDP3691039.1 hypothetical protein [Bradyrhizobium sp.]